MFKQNNIFKYLFMQNFYLHSRCGFDVGSPWALLWTFVAHLQHAGKVVNSIACWKFAVNKRNCDNDGEVNGKGRYGSAHDPNQTFFVFSFLCYHCTEYCCICFVNPLTPKIWLSILLCSCHTFPFKLGMRTWC